MGPQICGDRPNLAAAMEARSSRSSPLLGGAQNRLHHECYRCSTPSCDGPCGREAISPSDEAATKLIFLVLRQVARQWKMPPREWAEAKTQFAIMFGDRFVRT